MESVPYHYVSPYMGVSETMVVVVEVLDAFIEELFGLHFIEQRYETEVRYYDRPVKRVLPPMTMSQPSSKLVAS